MNTDVQQQRGPRVRSCCALGFDQDLIDLKDRRQTTCGQLLNLRVVVLVILAGCSEGKAVTPSGAAEMTTTPLAYENTVIVQALSSEVDGRPAGPFWFHVVNSKEQEMIVEIFERSCGCENLESPQKPVPVGSVARIGMSVDSLGRAEKTAYWAKLALVWGTDRATIKLRVEMEVLSELLLMPAQISHEFTSADIHEQAMTVKQRARSDTEPKPIKPAFHELTQEVEFITWEHVETRQIWSAEGRTRNGEDGDRESEVRGQGLVIRGQGSATELDTQRSKLDTPCSPIWEIEWRATLRLKATERVRQSPEGFVGQCVVACGDGEFQQVQIPIRLRCVDAIQASPPHTYLGQVKAGEQRTRTVMLRARDDLEFEIAEITCDASGISTKVVSEGARKLHVLQVALNGSVVGRQEGTVRVATTHPKCPEVKFSVEGMVEKRQ